MKTPKDWDDFYLDLAAVFGSLSYAADKKVGCVIVKDGNVLAYSYNGTPKGTINDTVDQDGKTHKHVLHAETGAIAKVARSNNSSEGATLYVTLSPCMDCAKIIYQAGISRVVFKEPYKDLSGIDFLNHNGIVINQQPPHSYLIPEEQLKLTGLLDDEKV